MALTSTVLIALVLGLFAGMAPGPYTTMVAATGLERGFRAAFPLALAPLLTDILPLLATVYLLTSLTPQAVAVLGFVGGAVVAAIGVRLLMRYRGSVQLEAAGAPPTIRFWHVVTGTLFSPAPWLFWLGVASPILIRRWDQDWRLGVVFLVVLFGTNMGSASALAYAASHGRRVLAPYWRQRILRFMGIGLVLAGGFLVLQAATGERMQIDAEAVEDFFDGDGPVR